MSGPVRRIKPRPSRALSVPEAVRGRRLSAAVRLYGQATRLSAVTAAGDRRSPVVTAV